MDAKSIRSKFLDFFKHKKHFIVPSAPMVSKNDPSLMFVNSGMAPFKSYFLGQTEPKHNRIANTQKCLRVSGKHNDLAEVGYDTYHHTMFEMLGNWSFDDYFKKEAIDWAWELLTEVYGINPEDLYVTVFEGDNKDDVKMDKEAYNYWKAILPDDHILMGNKKDNFWEMGDQGPCGPSSEIHIDLRTKKEKSIIDGKKLVNTDHRLVVEIWNLVFIQYNRLADGSLENLPKKHIDTGMGFERLCMVLQGVQSNYDTDVFKPIISEIESITNIEYGKAKMVDIAIRVIADHVRAVGFSIADGQLPSNNGAGYVIRRILRRAIRYGFTYLNQKGPFIYKLTNVLSNNMGLTFPEIKSQKQLIEDVIKEEEKSFLRTLDQGLTRLASIVENRTSDIIRGEKVFELYDTYGFPLDLTALILSEKGLSLDEEGFNNQLQIQKKRSRSASEIATMDWVILSDEDEQDFIGYDALKTDVKITRYRKVVSKKEGELYHLVFNETPFYAESGGQVGDKGYLEDLHGDLINIIDTKKENNIGIHVVENLPRHLNETFKAVVDEKQRYRTACNHTATHLLHQALREILGNHIEQKGSAVHSKSLRFDFSHYAKLSTEELKDVENFVNARIDAKLPLMEKRSIPIKKALADGAIALFGEQYGDKVRSVRFGQSVELCGGTHVHNTRDIWHFKIISESAIAAGIRRIEAITYDAVKVFYTKNFQSLLKIKQLLNNTKNPVTAVEDLKRENILLKNKIDEYLKEKTNNLKQILKGEIEDINGIKFLAKELELNAGGLKDLAFGLGNEVGNLFVMFATRQDNKALLLCYISKNLVKEKGLNAGEIVKQLGKHIHGGGGGQPFFATAGGRKPEGITEVLKEAKRFIS